LTVEPERASHALEHRMIPIAESHRPTAGLRFFFCAHFVVALLALLPAAHAGSASPPLDANAWNVVLMQRFEPDAGTNMLSVTGFNHALQFGQLLNLITAGRQSQVQRLMAFTAQDTPADITPLQSIEPYAVLNNRAVSQVAVGKGDVNSYNSPSYIIAGILADQPPGIYVIAMPADMINDTLMQLLGTSGKDAGITAGNANQYVVLTRANGRTGAVTYEDAIKPAARFPEQDLSYARTNSCPQPATRFTVPRPSSPPFQLNTRQTVYFIRHVEAHPNGNFENGNYVCQGAWRALGANTILERITGGTPKHLFTTNPNDIIGCNGNCSYIRPTLTIAPYAIAHQKSLKLARFQWNDAGTLAASLFTRNSTYSDPSFDDSTTLVAWEHGNIDKAVRYLIHTVYNAPASVAQLPAWSFTDYDTVWKLQTDAQGNLTFSNTCEHIDTEALPSTCPAFPSGIK
jgi:hypothetical protein